MHRFTSRILTVLSFVVGLSFLSSSFALSGLLGGLVDTVEEVVEVVLPDDDESNQAEDEQLDEVPEEDEAGTEEPVDTGQGDDAGQSEGEEAEQGTEEESVGDEPTDTTDGNESGQNDTEQSDPGDEQESSDRESELVEDKHGDGDEPSDTNAGEEPDREGRHSRPSDDQENIVHVDEDLLNLDGDDKYIRVENELLEGVAEGAGVGRLGRLAYEVQEGLLGTVTKTTGLKVERFYLWTCIGDVCLPVDPITFNR